MMGAPQTAHSLMPVLRSRAISPRCSAFALLYARLLAGGDISSKRGRGAGPAIPLPAAAYNVWRAAALAQVDAPEWARCSAACPIFARGLAACRLPAIRAPARTGSAGEDSAAIHAGALPEHGCRPRFRRALRTIECFGFLCGKWLAAHPADAGVHQPTSCMAQRLAASRASQTSAKASTPRTPDAEARISSTSSGASMDASSIVPSA